MAPAPLDSQPIAASEAERQALAEIERLLNSGPPETVHLTGENGKEIPLAGTALRLVQQVVSYLVHGQPVRIVPLHRELTTQEAADLLGVSRPYLIRLLDQGDIPYSMTGTHRRIRFGDLAQYRRHRDAARRETLDRLTQLSQDYGLYTDDQIPFPSDPA